MNNDSFTPLLTSTDWAKEWIHMQEIRGRADDASYWDERSKSFGLNDKPSDYAKDFIELAQLRAQDTILDMGCGNGALALPLAAAGHQVFAADFSSGMLGRLQSDMAAKGIEGITPIQMSWTDDWESFGIGPESVDVAFASRSIATPDIKDALLKLDAVARRRVCLTLSTGHSPRSDENVMKAIGLQNIVGRDYWYAINILIQAGIKPELNYIRSTRYDKYESLDDAYSNLVLMLKSLGDALPEDKLAHAKDRLYAWTKEQLIENLDSQGETDRYMLQTPRTVCWAFISWDK